MSEEEGGVEKVNHPPFPLRYDAQIREAVQELLRLADGGEDVGWRVTNQAKGVEVCKRDVSLPGGSCRQHINHPPH